MSYPSYIKSEPEKIMITLKNMPTYQEHTLQQDRLVFNIAIVSNAVPADKKYFSDIPGLTLFRTEGHTAEADAVETLPWTTPVDNNSGNSVFGLLLDLRQDEANKVYDVMICQQSVGSIVPLPNLLGTASTYGVLAASAITNTGTTDIYGDLGLSPGTSVTGAPIVHGTSHVTDAAAAQAQLDATTAYNYFALLPSTGSITAGGGGLDDANHGGPLPPGVYTSGSSMDLSVGATLTLDAGGDPNAQWVFQAGSSVTLNNGSTVSIINGGIASNVYWQVGSSATIGTTAVAKGTFISLASVTLQTGADLEGRALARTGAVTLDTNQINVPIPGAGVATVDLSGPGGVVNGYLTPNGNIAIEFNNTGVDLSATDVFFTMEVEYRERTGQP